MRADSLPFASGPTVWDAPRAICGAEILNFAQVLGN
jgi:hypothetical protein